MNSLIIISLLFSTVLVYAEQYVATLQSIFDFIDRDSLVFDVGAHIGNKTDEYLRRGARVVCFEPQPDCCQKLRNRFARNEKVIIEQVGLSTKSGFMDLSVCSSSNTISTFSKEFKCLSRHSQRGYKWDASISVPVSTFDNMIKKYGIPQFCKIDVENYEYDVLRGLSKPIPMLSIEFHIELFKNTVLCLDYLSQLGYRQFNFAAGEKAQLYTEIVGYKRGIDRKNTQL